MIPEIDIWRAASLMLKRYGEKALEHAQEMTAHESPRTTKLYDWTKERPTQDESSVIAGRSVASRYIARVRSEILASRPARRPPARHSFPSCLL
jgi:hypothetical protein